MSFDEGTDHPHDRMQYSDTSVNTREVLELSVETTMGGTDV